MEEINKEIFREYDIRGIAEKDLSDSVVERIGKAYGSYMIAKGKKDIVVGRDARLSSDRIFNSLTKGILSTGCNVYDISTVATPIFYFSIINYNKDGGMMITASHNPPQYNGFKVCKGIDVIYGKELKKLYEIAKDNNFKKGEGKLYKLDVINDYVESVTKDIRIDKDIKLIVDCGNGAAGVAIEKILNKFKNLKAKILFKEPDGNFPNHEADPTVMKNLLHMKDEMKKEKYDIGIAFDGDVDRIGVLDENGNAIYGDTLLGIYANSLIKNYKNPEVLFEVKCSMGLIEHLKKIGAQPVMWKVGHSLIKAKMKEDNILLGGEMSGHTFFRDKYYGFDDAFYAALRILEILSESNKTMSQLANEIPTYISTPEIRIKCPEEKKFEIVENLKTELSKYNIIDIDGVRVHFDNGWALVRASNTQPVLVLRFEAKSKDELSKYI
jgi:phosphomannomutase/phosphoglucomutase